MTCHTPPQTHIFFSSSFSYKIRFSESWLGHCRLVICHIMGSPKAREKEIHLRSKAEGLGFTVFTLPQTPWFEGKKSMGAFHFGVIKILHLCWWPKVL